MRAIFKSVAVAVLVIGLAKAQKPHSAAPTVESLSVCGVSLQLYTKQDKALAMFADSSQCELSKLGGTHADAPTYVLAAKGHPEIMRGELVFMGGAVMSIQSDWTNEVHDDISFAQVLIGLLHEFEEEGHTDCKVHSSLQTAPKVDHKSATIQCGLKSIDISLTEYKGIKSIQIDETLGI